MEARPAKDRKPARATTPLRFSPPWSESAPSSRAESRRKRRLAQPAVIRLAHWINIPLLVIMAGSGLQILAAYPALGPRGALYSWYPFQNEAPPSWLRFGGWLAGARHWHFAIAWFLILNGLIYLIYMIASGEWRRRVFIPTRDSSNAIAMFGYYLRIRRTPPPEDFYNGLQRMAYTSAILFGLVVVFSGLAIYKPVQLHWITAAFGGYDAARVVHLSCLVLLALFTVMHLVLVALHPRTIVTMVTGGPRG
ncbi:MAG: cytochrome b/b6 domain-containing protein [Candidatus Binatus sp.]|uniref:cytochrome b/b6 domain-containing protein n=1 Tax=Candidatus Binatus sp. TaxID=2811406 RepID=UPI003BAF93D6